MPAPANAAVSARMNSARSAPKYEAAISPPATWLALIADGKTNKEIAAEVFLSDKTVKNYVGSILSKMNLHHRAQAAAFVAKHRPPGDG